MERSSRHRKNWKNRIKKIRRKIRKATEEKIVSTYQPAWRNRFKL